MKTDEIIKITETLQTMLKLKQTLNTKIVKQNFEFEELPDNTLKITKYTGKNNMYLNKIAVPSEIQGKPVTQIGERAFAECCYLVDIILPDSIIKIGSQAFGACVYLQHINLPKHLKSIDINAFLCCSRLIKIHIPKSVKEIGLGVFMFCNNLKEITVDPENLNYTSENGILYNKNKTELICCPADKTNTFIKLPNTLEIISCYAVLDNKNVTTVIIPDSVKIIGGGAFMGCNNLKNLKMSKGIKFIGHCAFMNCNKLISKKGNYKGFTEPDINNEVHCIVKNNKKQKKEVDITNCKSDLMGLLGVKRKGVDYYRIGEWSKEKVITDENKAQGYYYTTNLFVVFNNYADTIDRTATNDEITVICECEIGDVVKEIKDNGITFITNRIKPIKKLSKLDIANILTVGDITEIGETTNE